MAADNKLQQIYYSPKGYWCGLAAINKHAAAAKVSEQVARDWLTRQAIWQINLPAPRHIPRPMFDEDKPNYSSQHHLVATCIVVTALVVSTKLLYIEPGLVLG